MSEQTGPRTDAPPAGWYADPAGGGGTRWWDGTAWTDQVGATGPGPGAPPSQGYPGPAGYPGPPTAWPGGPPLAGVGARFGAILLDGLILTGVSLLLVAVVAGVLALVVAALGESVGGTIAGIVAIVGYLALIVGAFLYEIVLTAGPYGQTIGKAVTGVRVIRPDGGRPTIGQSTGRALARSFLSPVIVYLGYLWALFDDRRRTWHDLLADTLVIQADPSSRPSAGELFRTARAPRT